MRLYALVALAVGLLVAADDPKPVDYAARSQNHRRGDHQPFTIIQEDADLVQEEEDLETRPVVYRAGKLPTKELPSWFMTLDTDKDGQVALYEWHRAGKDFDEFRAWDRNDDGYITAEEVLYKQHLIQIARNRNPKTAPPPRP